ncbi:MAG TPA: hypothetical protein VK050_06280 [Flavobacteriaceae bacterium]|nr:hypothetical protein [Flavobacteriaceae bacterium]
MDKTAKTTRKVEIPVRQAIAEDILVIRKDGSEHLRYGQPYYLQGKDGLIDKTYHISIDDDVMDLLDYVSRQILFVPSVRTELVLARGKDLKENNKQIREGLVIFVADANDNIILQPYVLTEQTDVYALQSLLEHNRIYIHKEYGL